MEKKEKNKKNIVEITKEISGDTWKNALKKSFAKNSKKIKLSSIFLKGVIQ